MVLFNQLTLCDILSRREELGTLKLRAAVAALTSEQRDNTTCFLKCSTEELAGLPDGQGIQAMIIVHTFLDYLSIIEPDTGAVCSVELLKNLKVRLHPTCPQI